MYLERFNPAGRTAIVTGGARGIGLACADALAEAGAHVVIVDCDAVLASEGLSFLRNKGHSAEAAIVDVTVSNDVEKLAADLDAKLGRLDVLVCNAGIARSGTAAEDVTDEQWMNVLDVNLNGVFWCCRAFGRRMLKAGRGAIVNVGSMSGFIGRPSAARSA